MTWRSRWYLLAWDPEAEDWRVFRADRMRPRTPNGPWFAPRPIPGGDIAAFVAARFRGADDDGWPCVGTAVLGLPVDEVAPFVEDGAARDLGDGTTRLSAGSWSWNALAASFGRFDAPITEVTPAELAEAFAAQARRFADAGASRA